MSDTTAWYKRMTVSVFAAVAFVGLIFGGGWLSTHQQTLQGAMPIVGVIALAVMVYGARSKKKPVPVSTSLNDAIAAVTRRTVRDETDLEEGHRESGSLVDSNTVLDTLYQRQSDRFTIDPARGQPPLSEKGAQAGRIERPIELPPIGAHEHRDAQTKLDPEQRVGVDVDPSKPVA